MFEAKVQINEKSLKHFIIDQIHEVYSNQDAKRPSECIRLTSDDSALALRRKSSANLIRQMTTKDGLKKLVFRNSKPIRLVGFILTYIFFTLYMLFMTPTYVILVCLLIAFAIPVVLITCCFDRISRTCADFDGWFKFFKQIAHGQPRFSFLLLWLVSNICNAFAFSLFIRHINFRSEIQSWEVGYWTYQFLVASLYVSVFRESYSTTNKTYRGFEFEKMVAAWAGRFQVAVDYRDLEIGVVRKAKNTLLYMKYFKLEDKLKKDKPAMMKKVKEISEMKQSEVGDKEFVDLSRHVNSATDELFKKIASTDEDSKTMYGTITFFFTTSLERMRPHSIAVMFVICMLPAVYIAIVCNWFFVDRHTLECESTCQVIQECCKVVQGNYDVTFIVANMVGNVIAVFVVGKLIVYSIIASHLGAINLDEQDEENQHMENQTVHSEHEQDSDEESQQIENKKVHLEDAEFERCDPNDSHSIIQVNRSTDKPKSVDSIAANDDVQLGGDPIGLAESANFDDDDLDGSSLTGLSIQDIMGMTNVSELQENSNLPSQI